MKWPCRSQSDAMKPQEKPEKKQNKTDHSGHRQHVRESYLSHGLLGEPDHRVLEMLLFFGIPYRDTNPIAHALIDTFGSFPAVLEASPEQLKQVKGMTMNASILLSMILPVFRRYEECLNNRPVLQTTEEIVKYIRPRYHGAHSEVLYALCFNEKATLISLRKISEGDNGETAMDFRALSSAALESGAARVTLVHNHPGGVAAPSFEDVQSTHNARILLAALKVNLDDHIIISGNRSFSMANSPRFATIFYEKSDTAPRQK